MPEVSDTAVCLRCWDWSETSQTVALFGRTAGMIRGLAKGSRRERSSFSGGFEPMTLGGIRAFPKSGSDLATLASWDLAEPWRGLRTSLRAHYAGCYLVDLIYHALAPEDPHPRLFDALRDAIGAIAAESSQRDPMSHGGIGGADVFLDAVMLRFHAAMLVDLGYQPDLELPSDNRQAVVIFDPVIGRLRFATDPGVSRHAWKIRETTRKYLVGVMGAAAHPETKGAKLELESRSPGSANPAEQATIGRATRFLVCHTGVMLSRIVPSLRFVYPDTVERIESSVAQ